MQTLEDVKKKIKLLLADNQFDKAFRFFNKILAADSDMINVIIALQGQYNSAKQQRQLNLAESDSVERNFNRIRLALIDSVDKLSAEDLKSGVLQSSAVSVKPSSADAQDSSLRQGIQRQLDITLKRLAALREAYAIQADPNLKFTLQMQIEQLEAEINDLRKKLGE